MSLHSFDPEIAKKVGLNAATIYQNLLFWCEKNKANEKHYHDGKWWTYNSIKAFDTLFNYLSRKQIRTALEKLKSVGLIEIGNYNKSAYDRTNWYTCTELNGHIDLPKKANEFDQKGEPIPDSKPDSNNTPYSPPRDEIPYQSIIDLFNESLPELPECIILNKQRKSKIKARWNQDKRHQSLEFWQWLFDRVNQSDFLMGRNQSGRTFKANFDFIITESKFIKIIEGAYL